MVEGKGNFKFEIKEHDFICFVTCAGNVNFEESAGAIQYLANHPDFKSEYKVIVDFREMNYHPSYADLRGIIDTLRLSKENFKNKVALVSNSKMEVIAKLAVAYCAKEGMKMKAFTKMDEAHSWIAEPDQ